MNINKFTMTLPSRSCNEGFARITVAAFAAQLDPTLDEIADIKTSVSEAVTNCNVHAYPDKIGNVYITCEILNDNVLKVKIRDKGRGIADVEQAMQPLYTTGGEERAGLGFSIMESFMDKLKVRSKEGRGTSVTLEKSIVSKGK